MILKSFGWLYYKLLTKPKKNISISWFVNGLCPSPHDHSHLRQRTLTNTNAISTPDSSPQSAHLLSPARKRRWKPTSPPRKTRRIWTTRTSCDKASSETLARLWTWRSCSSTPLRSEPLIGSPAGKSPRGLANRVDPTTKRTPPRRCIWTRPQQWRTTLVEPLGSRRPRT